MEVFKPIKVENYQFVKNGLNQYEPVLVYFKDDDDEEEGKVYFVKNKFDDKLEEWMEENLKVEGRSRVIVDKYHNRISIDVFTQDLEDSITDLEKRIEKLEEGFREIELKNRDKNGEIYDLVGRIREINRTGQRYRLSLYED